MSKTLNLLTGLIFIYAITVCSVVKFQKDKRVGDMAMSSSIDVSEHNSHIPSSSIKPVMLMTNFGVSKNQKGHSSK